MTSMLKLSRLDGLAVRTRSPLPKVVPFIFHPIERAPSGGWPGPRRTTKRGFLSGVLCGSVQPCVTPLRPARSK